MVRLDAKNLTKIYGGKTMALNHFTYTFKDGIYGLLGPNGAGKSTLIHLLTGNLLPDEGAAFYNQKNIYALEELYKKRLGYMPQNQAVYPGFTLERFLYYMASLKGVAKKDIKGQVEELLVQVNLSDYKKQRLSTFSGGMLQRALLAQALIGNPKVIILDEPTAGLDPKERIRLRNLIAEVAFNRVVLIATHVVSDIEYIAKEVILLKKGEILQSAAPAVLCEDLAGKVFDITCEESQVSEVCRQFKVVGLSKADSRVHARILAQRPPEEYNSKALKPSLEDAYLYYFDEEAIYD